MATTGRVLNKPSSISHPMSVITTLPPVTSSGLS
jgi:hypothetical protein